MRYGKFRGLELFIGSVTVEAADVRRFTSGASSQACAGACAAQMP